MLQTLSLKTPIQARMEHVNINVKDAKTLAHTLCDLLEWHIRWHGPSMGGYSYHVGGAQSYLALHTPDTPNTIETPCWSGGPLNHIGIVVEDLDVVQARARAMGYNLYSFGDYEPGRRFYFTDSDAIEFEIIHYPKPASHWWDVFFDLPQDYVRAGLARR